MKEPQNLFAEAIASIVGSIPKGANASRQELLADMLQSWSENELREYAEYAKRYSVKPTSKRLLARIHRTAQVLDVLLQEAVMDPLNSQKQEGRRSDAAAFVQRALSKYRAIWAIDFEFETTGSLPVPVAMVAIDVNSGKTIKLGPGEFSYCPFRCDDSELFVVLYAVAEASCFLALGWPLPPHWLDLWAEARRLHNGRTGANGLLDVMGRYGLAVRDSGHKKAMQLLVGEGNWREVNLPGIIAYCAEDVQDTGLLLQAMLPTILGQAPDPSRALPQAIIRGTFVAENARIERQGLPVDVPSFSRVRERWSIIRQRLIDEVDQ